MKKALILLVVLALAAPLYAVTATAVDNGDGTATITIPTELVALGLNVDCSAGVIDDVAFVDSFFDVFMDAAYDEEGGDGYVYGEGTPIADQTAAGQLVLPLASFAISAGGLGEFVPGTAPATVEITLSSTVGATGTIDVNALRGGMVDASGASVALDAPIAFDITNGPPSCADTLAAGDADRYLAFLEAGSPDCWCEVRQCHGNADNIMQGLAKTGYYAVGTGDLDVMLAAWQVKEVTFGIGIANVPDVAGTKAACANFDNGTAVNGGKQGLAKTGYYHVGTGDLDILLAGWQVKEETFDVGIAPDCLPGLY